MRLGVMIAHPIPIPIAIPTPIRAWTLNPEPFYMSYMLYMVKKAAVLHVYMW